MSRVRDLPESTVLADDDELYVVDVSEGPNGGKKVTVATLADKVSGETVASDVTYQRADAVKVDVQDASDDTEAAISDLDDSKLSVNGQNSMSADLDMSGHSVVNVTAVDGVDVSNHSARHEPGGSDALTTASAIEITDSTNGEGNATSFARSNHSHAHGNRGGGTLHAEATQSVAGFLSSTDKTKLDKSIYGNLNYSNSGVQTTTSTTFVNVVLNTDRESFDNGLLTKVNTTDFRAEFTGQVEISYNLSSYPDANDRAAEVGIQRNTTDLVWTTGQTTAKADPNRQSSAAGTFVLNCTAGDIFRLRIRSPEAALITIPANKAYMSIRARRLS